MSDLERLDEALTDYENAVHKSEVIWDQKSLVAAARAYRGLLANGKRVRWCEVHEDGMVVGAMGGAMIRCHRGSVNERCRFVPMLLVDSTTEEET